LFSNGKKFQARNYIQSLPVLRKKDFKEVFKGANPLGTPIYNYFYVKNKLILFVAVDLIEKMLELDADKRINAEQALAHPYLAQYADPTDEPVSPVYDQSFEDMELPVERWKGEHFPKTLQFFTILQNISLMTGL